jgi:hypothetical protein
MQSNLEELPACIVLAPTGADGVAAQVLPRLKRSLAEAVSLVLLHRFCLGFILFRPRRRLTAVLDWMLESRAQPIKGIKAELNEQHLFNM